MDKKLKITIVIPEGNLIVSSVAGAYKIFKAAIDSTHKNVDLLIAGNPQHEKYLDDYFSIVPKIHWCNVETPDLIIIPAMLDEIDSVIVKNKDLIEWLKVNYNKGVSIASLCTGSFLLAEAGLLDQKKCTTHWAYSSEFNDRYSKVNFKNNKIITEDERIFTSGGAYSFLNLIIYLVERYFNKDVARKLINIFQIDYLRESQDRFVIFETQKRHNNSNIIAAQNFIEENYDKTIVVKDIAKIAKLGERTLVRYFKKLTGSTPKQYQNRIKIEVAKDLLQNTNKQISEIQYKVGYADSNFFRQTFLKHTGMTPKQYKKYLSKEVA